MYALLCVSTITTFTLHYAYRKVLSKRSTAYCYQWPSSPSSLSVSMSHTHTHTPKSTDYYQSISSISSPMSLNELFMRPCCMDGAGHPWPADDHVSHNGKYANKPPDLRLFQECGLGFLLMHLFTTLSCMSSQPYGKACVIHVSMYVHVCVSVWHMYACTCTRPHTIFHLRSTTKQTLNLILPTFHVEN